MIIMHVRMFYSQIEACVPIKVGSFGEMKLLFTFGWDGKPNLVRLENDNQIVGLVFYIGWVLHCMR